MFKFDSVPDYLAWLVILNLHYLVSFWISQNPKVKPDLFLFEFSGFYILFNLQFSRISVVVHLSGNFDSISRSQLFVNNFFKFLFCCLFFPQRQLLYLITFIAVCQQLFYSIFQLISELPLRVPQWTFNIPLLFRLVKTFFTIFLHSPYAEAIHDTPNRFIRGSAMQNPL